MPPKFAIVNSTPEPLVLHDVSKRYGQGRPVIAGLSHTFAPGTATGLVGPNGTGKTTLLRLLTCLAYPTSGRLTYGTLDAHQHPHRYLRDVGVVHEAADLPAYLTAVELLEWVARAHDRYDADGEARLNELLDAVRLDERRDNLIGTYSSGMVKKTQVAAALAARPAVLLMDEPFRGLDAESTEAVLALLRAFHAEGGILILSSHIKDSLEAVCDHFLTFPHAAAASST